MQQILQDITKQLKDISLTLQSNKKIIDIVLDHTSLAEDEKQIIEEFLVDMYTKDTSDNFKGYGINAFLTTFKQYLEDNPRIKMHKNLRGKLKEVLGKPQKGTKWTHLELKESSEQPRKDTEEEMSETSSIF